MSLHANLRAIDRRRATQALTAWTCGDRPALDEVLDEAARDVDGAAGLVLALLTYADWLTGHTGPLSDHPHDVNDS